MSIKKGSVEYEQSDCKNIFLALSDNINAQ